MSAQVLESIIKKADSLTVDEQLRLVAYLAERVRTVAAIGPRRRWTEIQGVAPHPLLGEDAQSWVSRTRHEADEQRERQLRREP